LNVREPACRHYATKCTLYYVTRDVLVTRAGRTT